MLAPMTAILGIDAAWTPRRASGVALISKVGGRWQLDVVESSFESFAGRPVSNPHDVLRDTGNDLVLVAVDMPLASGPITQRRAADSAVSRAFGARGCAVHSPTTSRPGPYACEFREGFERAGFRLSVTALAERSLIEVYPHVAALALLGETFRVPYKVGRIASYWKGESTATRREKLIQQWARLVAALDKEIAGTGTRLPLPAATASLAALKEFEDALDAVICAWVGVLALEGHAVPYGDAFGAIWVPRAAIHAADPSTREMLTAS